MATRPGIAVIGAGGTVLLAAAGLGMLLAPHSIFRFVPYFELALVDRGHHIFDYNQAPLAFWAWVQFAYAMIWGGLFFSIWWVLPAQNKRIDAALRARLQPMARGAPLEPMQRQGD